MATVKLLLILATLPANFYAATSPNPRPPTEQLRNQSPFERFLPHLGWVSKIIACAWAAIELARLGPPTPAFVAGTLLILAGAALRAVCFRTLGSCFTFELAIRPTHVLVTRGVYAVVRHPSYTGVLAVSLGWSLCLADYCTWLFDAWGWDGGVATTATAYVVATAMGTCFVMLSGRMDKEDAMLKNNFGEEWRAWVKQVPYRLLPGIY